jgi:hypothetical protein
MASPGQLVQFERKGYFDVTGCHTGRRYRIQHGIAMNIHEIDSAGHPVVGWCFVPNTYLVAGDIMLAQKIALETDERAALAVAKSFSPKGGGLTMFVPIYKPERSVLLSEWDVLKSRSLNVIAINKRTVRY